MDTQTEVQMVDAAQQDPAQFAAIYTAYYPEILGFILARVQQRELAEDLASTVFEKALRSIQSYTRQEGVKFSAWLYQIAKRILIDHYRSHARRSKAVDAVVAVDLVADQQSVEQQVETEWGQEWLRSIIAELPERERKVLQLKFYNGYTNRLIAELTGLSETNVSTIIYRVVNKLKLGE